ncbi:hypothetical protein [Echinicola sp. 20G]|uniref:DUF7009 family protein n=1 Tax=Echinicola sp. 20G TaxID=2781961 RepID=UPI001910D8E0|nr:hypothetical protein [Echinicola sp. 20G]
MKLRINNNAIRLRLSQTEVDKIGKGLSVTEQLFLGSKAMGLAYSLVPDENASTIQATYFDNLLKITVPKSMSTPWATTDEVSMRSTQHASSDFENLILIEKDFQCLHKRPDEDESDNFPNPKSFDDY